MDPEHNSEVGVLVSGVGSEDVQVQAVFADRTAIFVKKNTKDLVRPAN